MKYIVMLFAIAIGWSLMTLPLLYPTLLTVVLEFIIIMYMYFGKNLELRPGKQYWLNLEDKAPFGKKK
jgi:hypothetical protein